MPNNLDDDRYCYDCTKDITGKGLPNDLQSSGKGTLLFAECTGCGDGHFDDLGIRTEPVAIIEGVPDGSRLNY